MQLSEYNEKLVSPEKVLMKSEGEKREEMTSCAPLQRARTSSAETYVCEQRQLTF